MHDLAQPSIDEFGVPSHLLQILHPLSAGHRHPGARLRHRNQRTAQVPKRAVTRLRNVRQRTVESIGFPRSLRTMTWYSPLVPLLVGMALLAVSAVSSRPTDGRGRWRYILALLGVLLALPGYALMTPLGANLLVLVIEQRIKSAEKAAVCDQPQAGVLLSGGLSRPAESNSDFGALTAETLARIFSWQNLVHGQRHEGLPWIIAGGGPFRIAEAEVIAAFVDLFDSSEQPLRLETSSTTTWESAHALRALLPHTTSRIVLASSALHLPRAKLAFEQAGFEVCPLVLNRHYMAVTGWTTLLPQSSSLAKSESALHELVGELFYRIHPPVVQNGGTRP
jgi:uncharacterized SAM-binding protein YcdF (DUF218 family)